jgi:hypothetical protein
MPSEPSTVAFFENQAQLGALLDYRTQSGAETSLIAVTAEADYAAEKAGLVYRTIEEFYSDVDLMERGILNFDRVQKFCDRYDILLREELSNFAEVERISCHYYTFALKGIFDSLLHRSVAVQAVFEKLLPTHVVCFDLSSLNTKEWFGLPEPTVFLASRLIPLVAHATGCQITWLSMIPFAASDKRQSQVGFTKRVQGFVGRTPLWQLLRWGKHTITTLRALLGGFGDMGSPNWKGPTLIYGAELDDAEALRAYWRRHGVGKLLSFGELFPPRRPGKANYVSLRRLWDKLGNDAELRSYFVFDGVDQFSLVESSFRFFTVYVMAELIAFAESAFRAFERVQRGVILMCGSQGTNRLVAKAAHAAGVPVVTQHYGEFFGYADWPMIEHEDLIEVDYFWCYGSGSEHHLQRPSRSAHLPLGTKRARPVAVGSPWLDELVANQRRKESGLQDRGTTSHKSRRVMYVFGALYGDRRYFSYHMYPDIWYWHLQRDVIKTCAGFPDVRLLVKPPPRGRQPEAQNPLFDWIAQNGISSCEVIHDKMFAETLDLADAFIIDTLGTALLQALATVKPVLVYVDSAWIRFDRRAMVLLRKRAIVSETREQFLSTIVHFLKQPSWTVTLPINDEFLRAHGTHLNDGQSVERAAELLVRLCEQSKVRLSVKDSEFMVTSGKR